MVQISNLSLIRFPTTAKMASEGGMTCVLKIDISEKP